MALQVWLPLNGNLKNKGCANVTFTQPDLTYTSGKIGQCAYFSNGIKTNTVTVSALNGINNFSVAMWIKLPSNQTYTNFADVINFGCYLGNKTGTLRLEHYSSSLSWFGNTIFTGSNGAGNYGSNKIGQNDTWQHLVMTCDGQKIYYYVNGYYLKEYSIPSDYLGANLNGKVTIGDTGNYSYLNDVRIYDHCLSIVEIKEISRGLVLHYKLNCFLSTGGNIIQDSSGYGNNGTISGSLIASDNVPRYERGVLVQNTSAYSKIINTSLNLPDGPITLSFWSKPTINTTEDTSKMEILFKQFDYWTYKNYTYFVHDTVYRYRWTNPWIDGKWHFVTGTYDGESLNIYIDGEIINLQTTTTSQTYTNNLTINLRGNNLSDFRIYATALSAEDIKQLYEVSAKIDNKKGLHCFELEEHNTSDNTKLFKTGIFKAKEFNEIEDAMKIKEDLDIESNQLIEM